MKRFLAGALFALYTIAPLADDSAHHAKHRLLRVFDANGRVIGNLASFSGQNGVAFTAGDATTVVPITRIQDASFHFSATDFQWLAVSSGQFTSTDCSGDPVILSAWGPRFAIPVRRGGEVTVYFASAGPAVPLTVRSSFPRDDEKPGTIGAMRTPAWMPVNLKGLSSARRSQTSSSR